VLFHDHRLKTETEFRFCFLLFASSGNNRYYIIQEALLKKRITDDPNFSAQRTGILAFQKETFNPFPANRPGHYSMPSPVAHTLFGLTCCHLFRTAFPGSTVRTWSPMGLVLLASLAPDLDFIPGLLRGDPGRYHQTLSHSLGASFLIALVLLGTFRSGFPEGTGRQWGGLVLFLILGHLFLDYFTEDTRPPIGFPLFWPFSERRFTSPLPVFPPLLRDPALPAFWSHNFFTMMVEFCILIPPWLVSRKLGLGRVK
jgi:membrane-bound metal-dependent hydrolase YbcI (DUF457 family)